MTALVIVAQPERVHVLTDAAFYTPQQDVAAFAGKTYAVPHWPGVITAVGNAASVPWFGWSLSQRFASFDDLIDRADSILPMLGELYDMPSNAELVIAGISASRGPEVYAFATGRVHSWVGEAPSDDKPHYRLKKVQDGIIMSPVANDQVIPANYTGIDVSASPDEVIWSMRKILEMQRHTQLPENVGSIGGFGSLTTVSADGIHERIICEWPEDAVGGPIKPFPIDWTEWHRQNPRPGSRLRREMAERKARKVGLHRVK